MVEHISPAHMGSYVAYQGSQTHYVLQQLHIFSLEPAAAIALRGHELRKSLRSSCKEQRNVRKSVAQITMVGLDQSQCNLIKLESSCSSYPALSNM